MLCFLIYLFFFQTIRFFNPYNNYYIFFWYARAYRAYR